MWQLGRFVNRSNRIVIRERGQLSYCFITQLPNSAFLKHILALAIMKSKRVNYTLLVVVLLLVVFVLVRKLEPVRKEAFDRDPDQLVYTRHARCRMDCRHISEADIREIMDKGVINLNRSNRRDRPCPTFAVQGETSDGQKIRVIFAQCEKETKVVTCYNLQEDFECHCPGDPAPKERKN